MIPTFTLEQSRVRKKNLKMVHTYSGNETVSHSNEGLAVGAALGKFDSSDSNERFRQMFTNVKIGKQKIEHLKNLTL